MTATCLGCDHRESRTGQLLCPGCRTHLGQLLTDLRAAHGRLLAADLTPVRRGAASAATGSAFGPRTPIREDVLALLITARTPLRADTDKLRNAPLLVVLTHWADRAREDDLLPELRGPVSATGESLRLSGILDQLAERWWIGDMQRSLAGLLHRAHFALGEVEPEIPLGHCPRPKPALAGVRLQLVADLGERLVTTVDELHCRGQVRGRRDQAACRRCGARWMGEAAVHQLGAQLGDAMLDLGGLSRYLGVDSVDRLYQWAHRDGWRREKVGRRTLYSLADARASAKRRFDRQQPAAA